ncbi:MAG: glycerol-3-phosphate dehydrogenase/oxidase [Actinomycetia bacterium]|nr:glycerol-3-phosphate dehydrogenase/oxidase [Actinomycetes bacterium]
MIVVGGGVVGAGSALDAATRGLRVALIEKADLASGTSSRSSRLAHGGLRYLENREFGLVREALTERGLLLDHVAPHLVRPLQFLLPLTRTVEKSYYGAGVTLYDLLSRVGAYGGTMPRPRTLSRAAVHGLAPALDVNQLSGAIRFHDAQIDDARHVVALARTAAAFGAAVVTEATVTDLVRAAMGPAGDRVIGVEFVADGETITGYARCVLSATGVWSDSFREAAGLSEIGSTVRQSKGVHVIVPKAKIRSGSAVIARTESSVLFLLPWGDNWLIGTTDTDYDGALDDPDVTLADVDYLLDQANRWLVSPLFPSDVIGVYCGLRPLVAAEVEVGADEAGTTAVSREHLVMRPEPGLVMVAGGKYTTYRVMAQDAVDAAVSERAAFVPGTPPKCVTREIVVVGGQGFDELWATRGRLARDWGLPEHVVEHLLRRHGDRSSDVAALIAAEPELAERIHPEAPYLWAEAVVAIDAEGARSVADVLVRRTRLALEVSDAGVSVAPGVGALLARRLGWAKEREQQEVQHYVEQAQREQRRWRPPQPTAAEQTPTTTSTTQESQ